MRLILAFLLVVSFSQVSSANPLCGPQPSISDANVTTAIARSAKDLIGLNISGQKLFDRATADFTKLQKLSGEVAAQTLATAYFFQACDELLGEKIDVSPEDLDKFEILGKALNNPKAVENFIRSAKATQNLDETPDIPSGSGEKAKQGSKEDKPELQTRGFSFQQTPGESATQTNKLNSKPDSVKKFNSGAQTVKKKSFFEPRVAGRFKEPEADCENFGEIGECSNLENAIAKLKEANLKYNHPDSMYLGKKTLISLIIETTGEDQSEQFQDYTGEIKKGRSKISRFMEASLTGQDFDIEPSEPQRKTLSNLGPTKWTWYVTPRADGKDKRLNLELSAVLRQGQRDLPPVTIKTFSAQINVDVRWWDRILTRIQAFDPVYQLGAAIGGVATAILLIWRLWAIFRRFGRKPKISE